MNLRKTFAAALLATAAATGMASANPAPTIIYICGSTAYRAPVTCAIINALGGTSSYAAGNQGTSSGTANNITKAQTGIFADGTVSYSGSTFTGSATTIVETNWTGSLAGTLDVATQNAALQFVDPTNSGIDSAMIQTTSTSPFTNHGLLPTLVATGNGANVITHAPEVAMSDSFLSSVASVLTTAHASPAVDGATTGAQLSALVTNSKLVEAGTGTNVSGAGTSTGYLGIVPFEWVLGNTALGYPLFSNISQQAADYLIKNGSAPATLFATNNGASPATANSAADFVYLIGRNEDSGTRIDALAEPGLGFITSPKQFLLTFAQQDAGDTTADLPTPTDFTYIGKGDSGNSITAAGLWPASAKLNTETSIGWGLPGHGGYAGGGDVSAVLSQPVNSSFAFTSGQATENTGKSYFIGYLGTADAGGLGTSGSVTNGVALTFNGVACSTANIQNGSYSFWSYEHMYYLPSGATGSIVGTPAQTFVDNLAESVAGTYAEYDSGGNDAPNTDAAGVKLLASGTAGSLSRTVEGGGYTLTY